jgi:hypothetical protein
MTNKSMSIRGAVLIAAMTVATTVAVASPLTIPPLPQRSGSGHVTMAASPLTIPPLPQRTGNGHVMMAASPLTIPPLPQGSGNVNA